MRRRVAALVAAGVLLAWRGSTPAFAAPSFVPHSHAGRQATPLQAAQFAPDACGPSALTAITGGSGNVAGRQGNDLLLGSAFDDHLVGGPGADCLVAGAGDDDLNGGAGNDVCIGGPGTDTFVGCEVVIDEL